MYDVREHIEISIGFFGHYCDKKIWPEIAKETLGDNNEKVLKWLK